MMSARPRLQMKLNYFMSELKILEIGPREIDSDTPKRREPIFGEGRIAKNNGQGDGKTVFRNRVTGTVVVGDTVAVMHGSQTL